MVFLQPLIKVLVAVSIIALQLLRESYFVFPLSTTIEVKPLHQRKAPSPIVVTEHGMVTEVKPEQPMKAQLAIPTQPAFKTIEMPLGIVPLYLYATIPA